MDIHERRLSLEKLRILHPRFKALINEIGRCHALSVEAAEPRCMVIHGRSGAGKSTLIGAYAEKAPPVQVEDGVRIPVLVATIPVPATMITMATELLVKLGDPMADRGTLNTKTLRLKKLLLACSVKIIILDEFQHFIDRDSDKVLRTVSDWLKTLITETRIPVVLTGLSTSLKVLEANEQLRRRFSAQEELEPLQWPSSGPNPFVSFLRQVDKNLPFNERSNLAEADIAWPMYCATEGLVAHVMKIVREAGHDALDAQAPRLDRQRLATAFARTLLSVSGNKTNPFMEPSPGSNPPHGKAA